MNDSDMFVDRLVKCIAASELPILPFPCLDSSQVGFVGDTEFLAVASAQEEPYIQLWISRQSKQICFALFVATSVAYFFRASFPSAEHNSEYAIQGE